MFQQLLARFPWNDIIVEMWENRIVNHVIPSREQKKKLIFWNPRSVGLTWMLNLILLRN